MRLLQEVDNLGSLQEVDKWTYIWGSCQYSLNKTYSLLSGHMPTHLIFQLFWKSKCHPQHSLFWLLLQDKLNTRDKLRRRHMHLESYTCENYILQRLETVYHLFLRCSFAARYWEPIGVIVFCPQRSVSRLTRQLRHSCALEIIMLSAWSI
jgi:hypothetical protein